MPKIRTPHPLAGKEVILQSGSYKGETFKIEDYWENVSGKSWMVGQIPLCYSYAVRVAQENLPKDNEVLYGKIGGLGFLIHISEV